MKTVLTLASSVLISGSAMAQEPPPSGCPAPQVPAVERPVKPTRPPLPSCVNEARGTHNCGNRVLTAYEAANREYQQAFTAYVAQVNSYIQKLEAYTRQAVTYAECERASVVPDAVISG